MSATEAGFRNPKKPKRLHAHGALDNPAAPDFVYLLYLPAVMPCLQIRHTSTAQLEIAYEESGSSEKQVVILLHGFPDDPRAWDHVAEALSRAGCRVIVPYLRGFGPTRFRHEQALRSGQQAAIGHDVISLMDNLSISKAILAGYDWGSRAACVVAALWPGRVRAVIPISGYTIQNIRMANRPAMPPIEYQFWYQWYFLSERGRAGLAAYRREFCELLWRLWSPNWQFTKETFARTAASFDNPDFVDVVIHSYRHRSGTSPGAPEFESLEERLAGQPKIPVPAIVLSGEADPLRPPPMLKSDSEHFTGHYEQVLVPGAGHFLPREAPESVSNAVLNLIKQGH
jgi:pimeloyl-ACP methyl ester carboxylesterase